MQMSLGICRAVQVKDPRRQDEQIAASSLLPMQRWAVIPGARFREVYYWDSYWVIRGLLVAGMATTAQVLVMRLLAWQGCHS